LWMLWREQLGKRWYQPEGFCKGIVSRDEYFFKAYNNK
jgi:hypothetical protein